MKDWLDVIMVALGGGLGSASRYGVGLLVPQKWKSVFPFATFFVNIIGAFLLGLVTVFQPEHGLKLLFADGFLGAFTTFSAFMLETGDMVAGKRYLKAGFYLFISLVVGVAGFALGKGV